MPNRLLPHKYGVLPRKQKRTIPYLIESYTKQAIFNAKKLKTAFTGAWKMGAKGGWSGSRNRRESLQISFRSDWQTLLLGEDDPVHDFFTASALGREVHSFFFRSWWNCLATFPEWRRIPASVCQQPLALPGRRELYLSVPQGVVKHDKRFRPLSM